MGSGLDGWILTVPYLRRIKLDDTIIMYLCTFICEVTIFGIHIVK